MKVNNYNQDQDLMAYNNFMMQHDMEQEKVRKKRNKKQYDRDNRKNRKNKWN